MAASVSKPRRLVNPGRKRRMTLKQKLHFGTKSQRAAAARRLHNRPKRVKHNRPKRAKRTRNVPYRLKKLARRYGLVRRNNVGEILTVFNPNRKGEKMARRRRRHNRAHRRRNVRYVRKIGTTWPRSKGRHGYIYSSNRGHRRNPSYRRRHNVRHYRGRRRNPSIMSGTFGEVIGVIAGASVTKLATDQLGNFVSMVSTGVPKYIAGAVVAFLQGKLIGKLLKNPSFGRDLQVGGYTYVALQILNDYVPSLPLGLSGMGLITSQNGFGAPYVPVPGSMTNFIRPAGVPAPYVPPPVTTGVRGLGRMSQRRIGRMA